uniref:Guanine nucleotide-binding protein-like 3 homolog n=1 Tax=Phallusia mammillata TaxID=59560 RepID=A0A6F9DD92_9ASCI|nr:guanine nucleotide-binding protein-like 3 homolog [Phallusia mammillata]
MKRPKLRKTSKRMSCSKRYRIEKNVKAHNKKVKREAKRNAASGKVKQIKKDPGIPNAAPFKEKILREAELRKQRAEEEKKRQKERRQSEINKRRSLEGLQKDALHRQKEFEQKKILLDKISKHASVGLLANETSRKSYYKEFRKVVDAADVVIEVLDARDPLGCRCLQVEQSVLQSGPNKRVVLLLNKIDLVPKQNVEEWLKYLRNEFPTVAFKASTQSQKTNLTQCKVPLKQLNNQLLSTTSQCVGSDSLMKLLSNYCRHNGLDTSITVGVVGFPNVGKSSVINSLKRAKACNVGAMPGITKSMQEVSLSKNIKILDCPGIVMATGSTDAAVILRNCVKIETLDDPVTPVAAILSRCNKQQMMMRYNITAYEDASEFLELLARRLGKLIKGGIPNTDAAAKSVLQDWNSGRLSYFTHPPLDKTSTHLDAQIVKSMAAEFDWESLEKDNLQALNDVKGAPSTSHAILYESSGPSDVQMDDKTDDIDEKVEEDVISDEISDMDADKVESLELGEISIDANSKGKLKAKKKCDSKDAKRKKASQKNLQDVVATGSNIQANKDVKALMKQQKRRRKRADKLSDKLGDTLLSAMSFTPTPAVGEDYDFDADMQLPK